MSYPYSQINRLEEPHNYMYTPFQGVALLQSYQSSRMAVVHRRAAVEHESVEPDHMLVTYALPALEKLFDAASLEGGKKFRALLEGGSAKIFRQSKVVDGSLNGLAKGLEKLTTAEPVTTLDLLHALIAVQLTNAQDANTKVWLDRLVQRFEVTKKLYETYPPGFRKGEGANTSVRLYWLFALALCLFYARSNEIKYLNTLLKVCDLLCSLPEHELQGHIAEHGLSVVLATEIVGVQLLAEKKGVSFASG
jgi:hypothetical protein